MLHARGDYNRRIQDSEKKIPENEPVFLLRAQDQFAARALRCYIGEVRGFVSQEIMDALETHLHEFINWEPTKIPDTTPEQLYGQDKEEASAEVTPNGGASNSGSDNLGSGSGQPGQSSGATGDSQPGEPAASDQGQSASAGSGTTGQ